MQQGPNKSEKKELKGITQKLAGIKLDEVKYTLTIKESVPEYFHHLDIEDAKTVPESLRKLCIQFDSLLKTPQMASHFGPNSIKNILDKFNEQYQKHFETFKRCIPSVKPKKIAEYQNRQNAIQESALLAYLKDVIGILNHINENMLSHLSEEQYNEISYAILNLFGQWLTPLETLQLTPSELHRIILNYILCTGIYIGDSYAKLGYDQLEHSKENAKPYFDKVLAMAYLNQQNATDYYTHYESNCEQEISLLSQFVFAQSFLGHFKFARMNLAKIHELSITNPWFTLQNIDVFLFYLECLGSQPSQHDHEILDWHEKISTLLEEKEVLYDSRDKELYQEYLSQLEKVYKEKNELYQTEITKWGQIYHLEKKYACPTQIIYTLPTAAIKLNLAKLRRRLASRHILVEVVKNELHIQFNTDVPFSTIKQVVSNIGKMVRRLETQSFEPLHPETEKTINNASSTAATTTENVSEPMEDTIAVAQHAIIGSTLPLHQEVDVRDEEKEDEREKEKEKTKEKEAEKQLTETSIEEHSLTPLQSPIDMLGSLLNARPQLGTFCSPEFKTAKICMLNGAPGLFVAYHPSVSFMQPKKLDKKVEQRFTKMFDVPCLANTKNNNGFKWISNDNGPCLVGKLTRLSFRLFPIFKEINEAGETAFLYGEIRNTKNGKKANRYS